MSNGIDRRSLQLGLAGTTAVATIAAPAPAASSKKPPESFSARSADGTMLAGEARGDAGAPEILFIHGLRQSRMSWEKQFADPALASFRLVAFDLRGHGDSDKPASVEAYAEVDRWAEDIAAIVAAAGLRRPVLVGWSLGAFAAGHYLRGGGGARVAGINLVAPVTKLAPELLTPLAGSFTGTTTSRDLAVRTTATAEFLAACFHRQPTPAQMQAMLVVNGMTPRAVNEGLIRSKITDLEPALRAYLGPMLLTHGAHDRLVRAAMTERLKAMHPDSRLSVFANSGHSPFYEEPARFGRELAAFTARAVARTG